MLETSRFRKSSYSTQGDRNCVECKASEAKQVHMRDTQNRHLGSRVFGSGEWSALVAALKSDEL